MRFPDTIYSLPFAESLRMGKYTAWVTRVRFTLEDVRTLVRIVGEYRAGASAIIDVIAECLSERDRSLQSRAVVALQGIDQMAIGERCSVDGWGVMIGRGRGFLRIADLPEAAHRGLDGAAPGVQWNADFLLRVPEGFEAYGKDASGKGWFALLSPEGVVSYLGADRKPGEAKDPSVFPDEMQSELRQDKTTRWAVERVLAAEHLRRLLWLADEFACRATQILELLRAQRDRLAAERRAVLAVELMCRMVKGERFDVDELERRMERGRAHLILDDLPETLRAGLKRAAPETDWGPPMMMPGAYLLNGAGPGKLMVGAHLAPGCEVSIFSYIEPHELPTAVHAAMKTRLPTQSIMFTLAVGPVLGKVAHYEVDYREDDEKRTLAISADAAKTWFIDPLDRCR
jgi:hypothetical protein